ncbi:hypothetical protein [Streptomyces sp. SS]|uniref:hypothetical protein n=1 Tax=Streptomyces sp. SS TaxID=260742 RepID=UPI000307F774|nr:hypothetical protein [Streptomyces sp. SS]
MSTFVYDADGNQLVRRNPGKTTLTFGTDELIVDTVSTATPKPQTGIRLVPYGAEA